MHNYAHFLHVYASLANVVNLRVAHVIEEHYRGNGHWSIFGDVSGFIKRELDNLETIEVDELTEFGRSGLRAKAG